MSTKTKARYGTWKSPVGIDMIARQVVGFEDIAIDSVTKEIFHAERRPADARLVIVNTENKKDVIDKRYNARSVLNAYGGRPMAARDGVIYFTNIPDFRVYKSHGDQCIPVSPVTPELRFGDLTVHPSLDFIVCICEDQKDPAPKAVITTLVSLNSNTGRMDVLSQGWDFYASPMFSPDGKKLAWTRWNHPDSAWHSMQLIVADVNFDGDCLHVSNEIVVAGEPGKTVAQQPQWLSSEQLIFLFDESGWSQPWIYTTGKGSQPIIAPIEEDFSEPHWFHGPSTYALLGSDRALCSAIKNGFAHLCLLTISTGHLERVDSPYIYIRQVRGVTATSAVFVGSTTEQGDAIVKVTLPSEPGCKPSFEVLALSDEITLAPGLIPQPRDLILSDKQGRPLHALFFPPTNDGYDGLPDELPPAVISIHSGPNLRPPPGFIWSRLPFTSRGWAWIDIMFAGTTGFGRAYQERLDGQWGVQDVEDCVEGTRQIAEQGLIDIKRIVVRGGTSGGFGVLQSAVSYPGFYAAGTSFCGVADLKRIHEKSLKFQMHYISHLVGGTPEEIPQTYKDRSPLLHADKIRTPLLLIHGRLDPQIPVEQTETIAKAVRESGGRADLIIFEDEAHGFRLSKNIKTAYQAELDFFEEILGLRS